MSAVFTARIRAMSPRASVIGLALFALVMALCWTALFLAEIAHFSPWPCLVAGLLAGVGTGAYAWRRNGLSAGEPSAEWVVYLLIALASLCLTTPPSEMVLGGWDPGVYIHTGASVAKQHALQFAWPDLAALQGMDKNLLERDLFGVPEPFGGMRVLPNGRISPQFYHGYPALLALAWSLGGVWAALLVNPLLNIGCIVAMGLLASRLAGRGWGVAAALLMALNPAQIWQAKFSTAEILTQFFILGGLVCWAETHRRPVRSHLWPLMAGAAFGLALLTRYDSMLLLVPLLVFTLLFLFETENRVGSLVVIGICALLAAHVWIHQHVVAPYYRPLPGKVVPALALSAGVVLAWIAMARTFLGRGLAGWLRRHAQLVRIALAGLFGIWAAFAWWVRPYMGTDRLDARLLAKLFSSAGLDGVHAFLAGAESGNMRYLAEIFGPLGLALGLAGVVVLILRSKTIWICTWLYAAVAVTLLLTLDVFHDHFLMWVARRYVPVVVPLLVVGVTVALAYLGRKTRPIVGIALLLVVLGGQAAGTRAVAQGRDWSGLIEWLNVLDDQIPEDALVFSDQPGFAAPLRFIYGHKAYECPFADRDDRRAQLTGLMGSHAANGETVLFLSSHDPTPSPAVRFDPLFRHPLRTDILRPAQRLPRARKSRGGDFVLYHVTAR